MDRADKLAPNKDTEAREATRKVSLARCERIFARLRAELRDIVDPSDAEQWKDFKASSSIAELTHTNSQFLVVSGWMASEHSRVGVQHCPAQYPGSGAPPSLNLTILTKTTTSLSQNCYRRYDGKTSQPYILCASFRPLSAHRRQPPFSMFCSRTTG